MRKVELRNMEQNKYKVIKSLVDNDGNKYNAALKLGVTKRTINRLIKTYKEQGKEGFMHGNRNRKPSITFDSETRALVIDLYKTKYFESNYTHFTELLAKHEGITISDTTVNSWLLEENIISPKANRSTKSNLRKKLKRQAEETKSKKVQCELMTKIEAIDNYEAHPRHPRAAYAGELIQMDASSYRWVLSEEWHLHVAIDDATGMIVGAYFDYQETLNGYYKVLNQVLINHGIPVGFLTDKRTVFEYNRLDKQTEAKDTFTQFSYACKQLGIAIKTSSVPQVKGRVERLNQTLQSRLPIELRIANVSTIEEANKFLIQYIKEYNDTFSLPINDNKNAFEVQPTAEKINRILAVIDYRKIDAGHSFKYLNNHYSVHKSNHDQVFFNKGTDVMVIKCFDGSYYVNIHDQLYLMKKIPLRYETSKELDNTMEEKQKSVYIPPIDHPWRMESHSKFVGSMEHRYYSQEIFVDY